MTVPTEIRTSTAVDVSENVLRYLGYDPDKVATKALVLLAQRYELDPLLGEIQLVTSKGGTKLYVTRDGMLAVAHRSGVLDGIVVEQQRRNSTDDGWSAYVSVWRKDMGHPFTYGAQCKDAEDQAKAGNGPEMALARAERRALRRAFQIRTDFYPDRPGEHSDDDYGELEPDPLAGVDPEGVSPETVTAIRAQLAAEAALTVASTPPVRQRMLDGVKPGDWIPGNADQAEAHRVVANLRVADRNSFMRRHGIEDFGTTWPPAAVAEILAFPADGAVDTGPAGDAST